MDASNKVNKNTIRLVSRGQVSMFAKRYGDEPIVGSGGRNA